MAADAAEGGDDKGTTPIYRDIRRYYCDFCGICRSKKSLISSHMLAQHKDEMQDEPSAEKEAGEKDSHACEECGASFKKPAHLKQHMQSHSLEDLGCLNDKNGLCCAKLREALDPM